MREDAGRKAEPGSKKVSTVSDRWHDGDGRMASGTNSKERKRVTMPVGNSWVGRVTELMCPKGLVFGEESE